MLVSVSTSDGFSHQLHIYVYNVCSRRTSVIRTEQTGIRAGRHSENSAPKPE